MGTRKFVAFLTLLFTIGGVIGCAADVIVKPKQKTDKLGALVEVDSILAIGVKLMRVLDPNLTTDAIDHASDFAEDDARMGETECQQSAMWFTELTEPRPPSSSLRAPASRIDGPLLAVIDGAADVDHPTFGHLLALGRDYVDGDDDPALGADVLADPARLRKPGNLHATALLARMAGVDPRFRLALYRVLDEDCKGSYFRVAKAMVEAVDDGADVILLALGSRQKSKVLELALQYAFSRGAMVVSSAGNDGLPIKGGPAKYHGVVVVAAVDAEGRPAEFTNYGGEVILADVGVDVEVDLGRLRARASGTSIAAAHSAASIATVMSLVPELDHDEILAVVRATAVPVTLRPDRKVGAGVVDVAAALEGALALSEATGRRGPH